MKPVIQVREKSNVRLNRKEPQTISADKWQSRRYREEARLRRMALTWLLTMLGFSLATTMAIFLLQGFGPWGFHLEERTLNWLGAATVGETVGIAGAVIKSLFG